MNNPDVSLVIIGEPASEELLALSSQMRALGLAEEFVIVTSGEATSSRHQALLGARVRTVGDSGDNPWRRGVQEARGEVVCLLRPRFAYRVRDLEYAIAMVQAGSSDIVIGTVDFTRSLIDRESVWGRGEEACRRVAALILGSALPARLSGLRVFSIHAAKLLYSETKMAGSSLDFEIAYLANKYGFRVDTLPNAIASAEQLEPWPVGVDTIADAVRIRGIDRRQGYRLPRRCPICFSATVRTIDQTNGHVIRECRRCKCKYLAAFPTEREMERIRDLRLAAVSAEGSTSVRRKIARERTARKRLAELRRYLPRNSRLFEIGAREGDVGAILNEEFAYVGIEVSDSAARAARRKGLEVYRSTLAEFVNLTGSFDAVLLYDVFQHLPNPHDALSRIKDQLKTGGLLVLVTPDTESFSSLVAGKRWSAYKVPEHVILYSRSALIELLEHSGFEIVSATSDYRYFAHEQIESALDRWPAWLAEAVRMFLRFVPDPLFGSAGSIRVVAKRRSGLPYSARPVPSVEATHAR